MDHDDAPRIRCIQLDVIHIAFFRHRSGFCTLKYGFCNQCHSTLNYFLRYW